MIPTTNNWNSNRCLSLLATLIVLNFVSTTTADDDQILGNWHLATDAGDASPHQNHGRAIDLKFDVDQPSDNRFDGRGGHIVVPHSDSLDLGTSNFSVSLWVHTEQELDDVLGDLVSQYDPNTRTGFHLSIQNFAGVTSSQSNHRHVHFGIDQKSEADKWTDHGRLGEAILIYSMAVFKGELFAGTCEAGADQAGHVFRYDGSGWRDCGTPDRCNAVSSLAVHRGHLYAGVSKYRLRGSSLTESENPHLGGTIYRYAGDDNWINCGRIPDVSAIGGMVVYRDQLYAGSLYAPASFYRYEGGQDWTDCGVPSGKRVESLTVHNGYIYASGYDEGAVYRYDGEKWDHLGVIEGANQTYGFATHRGQLYVSEWPRAKVFRLEVEREWVDAGRLGEEKETMPLVVYNGKMYGGTLPLAEVYRYDDPDWTKTARLDFTPDVRYRRTWTMAVFQGRLFAGTLPSGHVHSIEIGRNVTYDHPLATGWVHLTAVRAADQLRLYVNGKLVGRSTTFQPQDFDLTNGQPLKIGFGAHDYFNGDLQNVKLYRRALTENEIEKLAADKPK